MIRTLLAEDEPMARRTLRRFLDAVDWLEVVGEASDGNAAVEMIDRLDPELVFLDVRMPELSGLEVLEQIQSQPFIVFTTAYDQYAVAAFELEAVDYLLKPFGRRRFDKTLERLQRRLTTRAKIPSDLDRARAAFDARPLATLYARRGDAIIPIPTDSISHIEGADDYAAVHSGGDTYLIALRLGDLARRLDPRRFVSVHRSHIVNLDHVEAIRRFDERRLELLLDDGRSVRASRSGSIRLRRTARQSRPTT